MPPKRGLRKVTWWWQPMPRGGELSKNKNCKTLKRTITYGILGAQGSHPGPLWGQGHPSGTSVKDSCHKAIRQIIIHTETNNTHTMCEENLDGSILLFDRQPPYPVHILAGSCMYSLGCVRSAQREGTPHVCVRHTCNEGNERPASPVKPSSYYGGP